jgi:hypothetical protein
MNNHTRNGVLLVHAHKLGYSCPRRFFGIFRGKELKGEIAMPASVDQGKIKQLDTQLRDVQKQLHALGDENSTTNIELFRIIHNPGWTTILDVALAASHVEAVQAQIKALNSVLQSLQQGARNGLQETGAAGGH